MPTYEYECNSCFYRFEAFQQMKDNPLKKCPKCQGEVKRLISPGAGFIFKGSGFYATDYRSPSYKRGIEKEKGSGCDKSHSCSLNCPRKDKGQS